MLHTAAEGGTATEGDSLRKCSGLIVSDYLAIIKRTAFSFFFAKVVY